MSKVIGGVQVTPELVASLFWHMGSDEQADFFAALYREAGVKLAFQLAWVTKEVGERALRGEYDAMHGLREFSDEAAYYPTAVLTHRVTDARLALAELAKEPK